jgi:hypothetical protein
MGWLEQGAWRPMTMPDDNQWVRFLAALEDDCPMCAGSGSIVSEAWAAWRERAGELNRVAQAARRASGMRLNSNGAMVRAPSGHGHAATEAPNVMAAIERAIDEHERARPMEAERVPCRRCAGGGRQLSAVGRQLAVILVRHGFLAAGPELIPPNPGRAG